MTRSGLLLGVAAVLAGIAVLMAIFGAVANLVFFALALPFAAAAYFLWLDATGRLAERVRARDARRSRGPRAAVDGGSSDRRRRPRSPTAAREADRREARRVLGVDPGADDATVRRAYRERVKDVHPDADGGSEEAFKRVSAAYERLVDERS